MKMETNKMWQIFMLTTLLTLAGCKNGGGEYSQSVSEYATMQVAPVNKTLFTQYLNNMLKVRSYITMNIMIRVFTRFGTIWRERYVRTWKGIYG